MSRANPNGRSAKAPHPIKGGDCGDAKKKNWVPYQGKFKVIKLKTNMGVTPEMTFADYCKLHPNYKP